MTNKALTAKIANVVDQYLALKGYSNAPGQKGGQRETGNVMVGLALDELMPQLRAWLGLPSDAPALAAAPKGWSEIEAGTEAA